MHIYIYIYICVSHISTLGSFFVSVLSVVVFFFLAEDGVIVFLDEIIYISKIRLSILTDFTYVAVYIISFLPLFPNSPGLCHRFFGIGPSSPTMIGITVIFTFHIFFSSQVFLLSFFHSLEYRNGKTLEMTIYILLVEYSWVWSSSQDWRIRLYLKVAENFMRP